jgi:hypothetical protein
LAFDFSINHIIQGDLFFNLWILYLFIVDSFLSMNRGHNYVARMCYNFKLQFFLCCLSCIEPYPLTILCEYRFVPCEGTERLPFQPRHEVCLTPPGELFSAGYFNFSHALRATIMAQGDAVIRTLPPQAFLTDEYRNGNPIDVYMELSEVEALKDLHLKYWTGVRYTADGTPIGAYEGVGGVEGAGEGDGGAGSSTGGGGVGGASGLSPPLFQPIGTDGTVTLSHPPSGEGGSGS